MDPPTHIAGANAGIVPAVEPAVGTVPLGIVKSAPRLAVIAGSRRLSGKHTGRPSAVMGLQTRPIVRRPRGQLQQTIRQSVCAGKRPGSNVCLPETVDRYEQPASISLLLRQLARARVGLGGLRCFKPFGCEQ